MIKACSCRVLYCSFATQSAICPLKAMAMAMATSFAHLWLVNEFSDVDVLLTIADEEASAPIQLAKLPTHKAILSQSPVLRAQLQRWHHKRPSEHAPDQQGRRTRSSRQGSAQGARQQQSGNGSSSPSADQDSHSSRPQIVLTLQDDSQQAAAMACLEALYATKPVPELLSQLSQEQQLQAAVLADMWEIPNVSTAAIAGLARAGKKLSEQAAEELLRMPAHPACLQPLLKQVLLRKFGNLEKIWADEDLRRELLALSLSALEVLLSCDELKVAAKDTVLFTAEQYCQQLQSVDAKGAAKAVLAQLIRCPHLYLYWVSAPLVADNADEQLLYVLRPQLQKLLAMRLSSQQLASPTPEANLKDFLPTAPDSWHLQQRAYSKVDAVALEWSLSVEEIRAAARRCAEQHIDARAGQSVMSAPLGGMSWRLEVTCAWNVDAAKLGIVLSVVPVNVSPGMFCTFKCRATCCGTGSSTTLMADSIQELWYKQFFVDEDMAGGWDEVAWANAGWPSSGDLTFKLKVFKVDHS